MIQWLGLGNFTAVRIHSQGIKVPKAALYDQKGLEKKVLKFLASLCGMWGFSSLSRDRDLSTLHWKRVLTMDL